MSPRAEVIGDPIAHSKSPLIHGFWLEALGLDGDFAAVLVPPEALPSYFEARREDPEWRGCSVTAPLKQAVIPFLHEVGDGARAIGAVNCILPGDDGPIGLNTDVDGIAEALEGARLAGAKVAIIGGGGAARAAVRHCGAAGAEVTILVRDPGKASSITALLPEGRIRVRPIEEAEAAVAGVAVIINATPLGMAHAPPMPAALLAALAGAAPGAIAFDMVYDPIETGFLASARATGIRTADGLVMLIGQARRAFWLFFGAAPPTKCDVVLRRLLLADYGI